jgi:hypothetical protein
MKSYSQAGQDRWVIEKIQDPKTFLDIGASQAVFHNNTYLLELSGWVGTCIDKDPVHSPSHLGLRVAPLIV